MTFAQTWWIWLTAGVIIVPLLEWYRRRAVKKEDALVEARMRQFEKMAEHGSPAMGMMPMVMSSSGSFMADELGGPTVVWLVGLGFAALLICSLLTGIGFM